MLQEMKEANRSKHSGTVVKKKSSSGCLIIKKKVGFSDSSSRNLFKSSNEKKRRRGDVDSDSESSDNSLETTRPKADNDSDREFATEKKVSNGLDVFEFDEYDGFDHSMIKKDANNGTKYKWNLTNSKTPTHGTKSRLEMEEDDDDDDDSDLPLSVLSKKYKSSSNKSIRLQGKNGVSKVMVNKQKQTGKSSDDNTESEAEEEDTKEPNPKVVQQKKLHVSVDTNKKSSSKSKKRKVALKSRSKVEVVKSVKKNTEIVTQVKNGGSSVAEKQKLREKIKKMLFGAGWTIDYRPRRNKDYQDSVYISPGGTAYWSITKAYDALQKEEEDNFTPLPDEILGKLTRQTQKKREREMKKKQIDENNTRKSKKSRLEQEEESQESGDESSEEEKPKSDTKSHGGRNVKEMGRCTLLARDSDNEFVLYSGKRTLLSWLIDSGVVHLSEHVACMNLRKTKVMQKGRVTKEGICCACCNEVLSVVEFAEHAGSKLAFPNVYLQKSGKSLMHCGIEAWNKQGELERKGFYELDVDGDDPNDDTCGICGDGGDLICCDSCPSTFHHNCLDIQMLPEDDWHCRNCSCKYCEIAEEDSLVTCCFCQMKYHESCRPQIHVKSTESNSLSFCGNKCHELYSELQKLVGVKHKLDSGLSWSIIRRSDISTDASSSSTSSIQLSQNVESNSMLAVAMSIMDECFLPITDRRSGTNLIRHVVFNCGSNLNRLNYSGFYMFILEKGDEVVSAASIRIHGTQLAEMPFIGTRHIYRRKGMCSRLLSAIESALSTLGVEKLIIPAVAERMHTWTDVFGFQALEESHKQEVKCLNMLVFPGTDMLQKPLHNHIIQGDNNTVEAGDDKALSKKSESISCDVKECSNKIDTIHSGNESTELSKETIPIDSPAKDVIPSGGIHHNTGDNNVEAEDEAALLKKSESISCDVECSNTIDTGSEEASVPLDDVQLSTENLPTKDDNANTGDNNTVEAEDDKALSKKSESISCDVKECNNKIDTVYSGNESTELSKETLPIHSPVKDEIPSSEINHNTGDNNTVEADDDKGVSKQSESISYDVKECSNTIDSGSEEVSVTLDNARLTKETLPVKKRENTSVSVDAHCVPTVEQPN